MVIILYINQYFLDTLSEVSSKWRQITRSRNFWKTSCQLKWTNIVVTDTMDFNKEEYLVPTVTCKLHCTNLKLDLTGLIF